MLQLFFGFTINTKSDGFLFRALLTNVFIYLTLTSCDNMYIDLFTIYTFYLRELLNLLNTDILILCPIGIFKHLPITFSSDEETEI